MKKYRILNLYACLGGNRYKWDEVADNLEIVAVELDPYLAKLYQERFPNDKVIVGDAHQYLLDHYKEFDFIWSSPPCPTHSTIRQGQVLAGRHEPKYPDMNLYQEIIFLDKHFKGKWLVENVIPYYTPLIPARKIGRHLFWTNFLIGTSKYTNVQHILRGDLQTKAKIKGIDYAYLSSATEEIMGERFGGKLSGKIIKQLYTKTKSMPALRHVLVRMYSMSIGSKILNRLNKFKS